MRQAFAGMLWSKQLYAYDVRRWLEGDPTMPDAARRCASPAATAGGSTSTPSTSCRCPTSGSTRGSRRGTSGFHCVALAHVDPAFAKYQLTLICREWFQHPNGALPAYEWDFGDVNPPVQAWAALQVFAIDGAPGHRLPEPRLRQAARQLHVVGQPRGRERLQPLRGRLPRARQHRTARSIAPAGRRHPRAVRRHRAGWPTTPSRWGRSPRSSTQSGQRPAVDLVIKFLEHFAAIRDGHGRPRRRGTRPTVSTTTSW